MTICGAQCGLEQRSRTRGWYLPLLVMGSWCTAGCTIPAANGNAGDMNNNAGTNDNSAGSNDNASNGNANGLDPDVPPITQGDWYRPPADSTWQWQLQPGTAGVVNTGYDVDLYDIDLFDVEAALIAQLHDQGRRVICYFSAGSFESFRVDAAEFQPADLGTPLDDFADENWLDIRSTNVHRIMEQRLDLAVTKGCDGVEPDNVAAFQNDSGFPLSPTDQLAFNRFIANAAHQRGLAVALKNDLSQINDLVDYFDFAVNEQCHEFDECDAMVPFIEAGKAVFNAEYDARYVDDAAQRAALCAAATAQGLHTLVLPVDLDDAFRFSCD